MSEEAQTSSLNSLSEWGRVKGESLGGLSTEKIVVVVVVLSYDILVMGVNVSYKCVLRYNRVAF